MTPAPGDLACASTWVRIMKCPQIRLACGVAWLCALGFLAGCAVPTSKQDEQVSAHYQPGVPGGTYVETYQTVVTITAMDPVSRRLTLVAADGTTNVFQAGASFTSFSNYHVGDQVKVAVARELCAWFPPEAPANSPDVSAFLRRQSGLVPGIMLAPVVEISATVLSVNPAQHTAEMRLSDGRTATFQVRRDIDLNQVPVGTTGFIRTSAAVAFMVQKP